MAKKLFRVKFIAEGRVERAPSDPKRGGYEVDVIPVGTVKEMKAASVNFWNSRGKIQVLGPVESEATPVEFNPFAVPPVETAVEKPKVSKVQVRNTLTTLFGLLSDKDADLKSHIDGAAVALVLETVEPFLDAIEDYLNDTSADSLEVLRAACEDARTGLVSSYGELHHALGEIILTIWPSRARK